MRKLIISGFFAAVLAGMAFAADRDRHADYSGPKAAAGQTAGQTLCKGFYGGDDNLTACADWCGKYRTDNEGATCECGEGKCAADDHN